MRPQNGTHRKQNRIFHDHNTFSYIWYRGESKNKTDHKDSSNLSPKELVPNGNPLIVSYISMNGFHITILTLISQLCQLTIH